LERWTSRISPNQPRPFRRCAQLFTGGTTDTDPCFVTGQPSCQNWGSADFDQKRTHTLSNDEIIWDFSGNVYEWVKDDLTYGEVVNTSPVATMTFNEVAKWGPQFSYTDGSFKSSPYGGLGYLIPDGGKDLPRREPRVVMQFGRRSLPIKLEEQVKLFLVNGKHAISALPLFRPHKPINASCLPFPFAI
jgi:hypothetical protein